MFVTCLREVSCVYFTSQTPAVSVAPSWMSSVASTTKTMPTTSSWNLSTHCPSLLKKYISSLKMSRYERPFVTFIILTNYRLCLKKAVVIRNGITWSLTEQLNVMDCLTTSLFCPTSKIICKINTFDGGSRQLGVNTPRAKIKIMRELT